MASEAGWWPAAQGEQCPHRGPAGWPGHRPAPGGRCVVLWGVGHASGSWGMLWDMKGAEVVLPGWDLHPRGWEHKG